MRTIMATLAIAVSVAGCAGTQVSGARQRGFIVMDVEPSDALIYVDGRFMGSVDGWAGQTVVVDRGMAFDENLAEIRARHLHYLVAARQPERDQWLEEWLMGPTV